MTVCRNCNYNDPEDNDRCPSCNFQHVPSAPVPVTDEEVADAKVSEAKLALEQAEAEAAAAETHAPPVAVVEHPSEVDPVPGEAVTTGAVQSATFPSE